MSRLSLVPVLAAALLLPACASSLPRIQADSSLPDAFAMLPDEPAGDEGASAVDVGHTILMYIPNRILDAFDMVRAGVNVGPGVGLRLKATEPLQISLLERISAGAGLQSLRHLPVYASAESATGVGPLGVDANLGIGWYQSPTDIRVEAHVLIVGAHVAIDPVEIVDFILGLFTIDIRKDDF